MLTRRKFALGAALLPALAGHASAQESALWAVPDDAAIRKILAERIDIQASGVGIVVGVVDASGRRVVSHGSRIKGQAAPIDARTMFEIGSMTKVFTSLLLTQAVRRGEVALDDPAAKYLPPEVKVPSRNGRQITLVDLATHTSGLPSLMPGFSPTDQENPYADYTVDQLYKALSSYELTRDVGSAYAYSNTAVGLLGHILARRVGTDYASLVKARISEPLGLRNTTVTLSPEQRARLAQPYTGALAPTKGWDIPTLAGAGALRSDAEDVMTFLSAAMGLSPTPLKPAFDDMLKVRRPAQGKMEIALGWHLLKRNGAEVAWHNGGTGGYRTFMGYDPARQVGVVVLTNAATQRGGDDIGFHLLTGAPLAPAPPAPVMRTAVTLTEAQLEPLVGRYAFAPTVELAVTHEGTRLFAQLTGQGRAEIFPESPTKFFWKIVDAQLTFRLGPDGQATGLILHQNGRDQPAGRVSP